MPKGKLIGDTFETLFEFGKSTAKQTVKSVSKTFNPLSVFETQSSQTSSLNKAVKETELTKKDDRHTSLDFEKLQKNYRFQEEAQQETLRNRLFQLVKQGEQKVFQEKKQQEQEKLKQKYYQQEEKKRQEDLRKQQSQEVPIPRGKIRRSIFSPKKTAERQHTETKPAVGKQ